MKNWILLLGILLSCLSSCGSHDYEKAIADWLQTDENGTWKDLKFELIKTIEIKDITVADSIRILQVEKEKKISWCNKEISRLTQEIEKVDKGKIAAPSTYFRNRDRLKQTIALLDSIQSSNVSSTYDNREKMEVLAKLVKCRYGIMCSANTAEERTETFLLSSDLKKCIGRMK